MRTIRLLLCAATFLYAANSQTPITVVNGASFQATFPVAPGSLASIFPIGSTFGGVGNAQAQTLPLPTELGGVRVLVNQVAAPLVFVSAGQINFQVPHSTPAGRVLVQVTAGGNVLGSGNVDIYTISPAVFVLDQAGIPQGAILNQNNTVNSHSSRARRGEVIQIFATGQGPVSTIPTDGAPPSVLTTSSTPPRAYVSVAEAQVEFSGLSPEFPGVWQLNLRIPDRPYVAGQVPLVVTINGVESNIVSFWVAE
jgi:uncharacterized protein (TIGR03437 family)